MKKSCRAKRRANSWAGRRWGYLPLGFKLLPTTLSARARTVWSSPPRADAGSARRCAHRLASDATPVGRHLVTHLTSQAPLARSRVHGATCESEEPTLEIGLPTSVPALTVDGEDVTETLAALAFRLNSLSGFPPPSPPPSPGFPPPAAPPPAGVCDAAVVNGFYYDAQSGHKYATIDGTSYSSTTVGCTSSTASGYTSGGKYYHSLPTGWEVAPADADGIRMSTIAGWGTHILVYSDGTGYGTTLYSPGNYYASDRLLTSGGGYSVNGCSLRVLIRVSNLNCPSPPPSPPAAFYLGEIGTNDCGSDSVVATQAGCQEAAGVLGASYGYAESWSNNPGGGCFYIHPASNFYFNLDATGGLRDDAGNVCYGTGY